MNDFTKDELEEIAEMLRHARKQGVETKHNLSYEVELKALSLIGNYCEHPVLEGEAACQHESDGFFHNISRGPGGINREYKCLKCEEFYG